MIVVCYVFSFLFFLVVGACRQASNSGLFVGLTPTNNVEITIDRVTTVTCLHLRRSETQEVQKVMWWECKFLPGGVGASAQVRSHASLLIFFFLSGHSLRQSRLKSRHGLIVVLSEETRRHHITTVFCPLHSGVGVCGPAVAGAACTLIEQARAGHRDMGYVIFFGLTMMCFLFDNCVSIAYFRDGWKMRTK